MTDAQADVVPGLEAALGVRFNDHDLALTAHHSLQAQLALLIEGFSLIVSLFDQFTIPL